nr:MAG TPA: hypothetical protein [Caudoviricetes sp.]
MLLLPELRESILTAHSYPFPSMATYMWRSTRKPRARCLSSWSASIMPADTRQMSTQKRPVFRFEALHMTCRV